MMERTGQVKAVTHRDFQTTKLWSFQLEGSDRFFRTGKVEPKVSEGEWIKFNEKNGIVLTETITITENAESSSKSARTPASTEDTLGVPVPTVEARPEPSTSATIDVGQRIRYQAARRDASNIVIAALHTDHLPHATNVAKGKRLDLLLQYVEEVTQTLLEKEEAA